MPATKPQSGSTRLLNALRDTKTFPAFAHPTSGYLLTETSAHALVTSALTDTNHPLRAEVISRALAALDATASAATRIVGRDPKTNQPIYSVAGLDVGVCRSCGATIYWAITPNGKRCPVTPGGVSHFTDCPNAAKHSRKGT